MEIARRASVSEWPVADKICVEGYWFLRLAENRFERAPTRFCISRLELNPDELGAVLADLVKSVRQTDDLIAELEKKGWHAVCRHLRPRRQELAVAEAAGRACKGFIEDAEMETLLAYYQEWVPRCGAKYGTQSERLYWCCRDYLAMVNNDVARTDFEDFPLQHRHYAAQNLAARFARAMGDCATRATSVP